MNERVKEKEESDAHSYVEFDFNRNLPVFVAFSQRSISDNLRCIPDSPLGGVAAKRRNG